MRCIPAWAMLMVACSAFAGGESPYAGQERREIKALDPDRIQAYLAGSGMGYAKAAELNHYPGPKHVLELSQELELSDTQIEQTRALFDRMQREAQALGADLVGLEAELDQAFATASVTPESLSRQLEKIAALEGRIRLVHLAAHLEQRSLLSERQLETYDRLRGYRGSRTHEHSATGHHAMGKEES